MNEEAHILVVDDEPDVRRTVGLLLSLDGYKVTEAGDGFTALELAAKQHFDLVITDFLMPCMKGHEFAARIKASAPRKPVLMITAHLGEAVLDNKVVDAFLNKPFDLGDFRRTVARLIHTGKAKEENQAAA